MSQRTPKGSGVPPLHEGWFVSNYGAFVALVFFPSGTIAQDVKKSLVEHDGYSPTIQVRRDQLAAPPSVDTVKERFHAS